MCWPDDAEMASVERDDGHQPQPLRSGHQRRVDGSQRQVAVLPHELRDSQPVSFVNSLDKEFAGSERSEKANLGPGTKTRLDQIRHLRDHENRDQKWAGRLFEYGHAVFVPPVVGIGDRVERSGVDEDGYRPASSLRISSIRCETSPEPLRPAAVKLSCPLPPR